MRNGISTADQVLLLAAISGLVYLTIQVLLAWRILRLRQRISREGDAPPPVSVVVAAHNEAERLPCLLADLFAQQYETFEVVLVLDRSTDGSKDLLKRWEQASLKVVEVQETPAGWAGKKWALACGIDAARHDVLLFTDADCRMGPCWIRGMAGCFSPDTEVVIGLGPYQYRPGWLNRFIRWETFHTAFLMAGFALAAAPYMAVGRNLAYRRSFFQRAGGFARFQARLSGDDDLLINAFAHPERTTVCMEPEAATWSAPKTNWRAWFRQKMRHTSSAPAYSLRSRFFLALFHGSHALFYFALLINLLHLQTGWAAFTLYVLKMTSSWILFAQVSERLPEKKSVKWFPVLDLFTLIYNLTLVPIGLIKNPKWN